MADWPASVQLPVERRESDGHLIPEGGHRRDWLQFFVSGETFESTYAVGRKIGEGGFGKVFMATHTVLGTNRAVKRISKTGDQASSRCDRKNELAALLALDHPHIVRLVEYFDEDYYLYLVFELCDGPDLYDRIRAEPHGRMSEFDASLALRHMLKALQYCHSQYRGHYDIKPENFMYASKDLNNLQMVDLGMSSGFDVHRKHNIKGTAVYMAPELWDGIYGPEGDVWSCGVVLFVMLTGQTFLPDVPPSTFKREVKVKAALRNRLRYASETFNLSANAQDLLTQMLAHDRHGRPSVKEALNHQFNQASYDKEIDDPQWLVQAPYMEAVALQGGLAEVLRAVSREPMMKRVARLAMAHICSGCEAERLAFRMLDRHGYGELSISVLEKDFEDRGVPIPEDLDDIFEAVDLNRDGYLGYLGFVSVTLPVEQLRDETLLKVAFGILDQGKDGFIDAADLASIFGRSRESRTCQAIVEDVSPEGRVSWERFVQMMGSSVSRDDLLSDVLSQSCLVRGSSLWEALRRINHSRINTDSLELLNLRLEREAGLNLALLHQMMPAKVASDLRAGRKVPPEVFDHVTIFFSDIEGFTKIAAAVEPSDVVHFLNELYIAMDYCAALLPIYKVETIGDAYMVVGGLPERTDGHQSAVADFALLVREVVKLVANPLQRDTPVRIRIGIHSGPVIAGVVGNLMPRYCLFGDTVNTASRMESTGASGRIHCSSQVGSELQRCGGYSLECRGPVEVKGKGSMTTYWLQAASGHNERCGEHTMKKVFAEVQALIAALPRQISTRSSSSGQALLPRPAQMWPSLASGSLARPLRLARQRVQRFARQRQSLS